MPDENTITNDICVLPAAISELDLLRLHRARAEHRATTAEAINERAVAEAAFRARANELAQACVATAKALDALELSLHKRYGMTVNDTVDSETGAITRAPVIEAIAVPALDAAPAN